MSTQIVADAILNAGLLLAALFLLNRAQRAKRELQRDELRFRLFAARDALYAAVARGEVPVDGRDFTRLRDVINGVLVMNRELDLSLVLHAFNKAGGSKPDEWDAPVAEAIWRKVAVIVLEVCSHNSRLVRWYLSLGLHLEDVRGAAEQEERPMRSHSSIPAIG